MDSFSIMLYTVVCSVVLLVVCYTQPSCGIECSPELELTLLNGKFYGSYKNETNGIILFKSSVDGNRFLSTTSYIGLGIGFRTDLSFPYTDSRKIPGIVEYIVSAAQKLSADIACNLPSEVFLLYEEFSEALHNNDCTDLLGSSQLRYGPVYHTSIVGTAGRVCEETEPFCTPSPNYEFGDEMFMCLEDLKTLFKQDIEYIRFD